MGVQNRRDFLKTAASGISFVGALPTAIAANEPTIVPNGAVSGDQKSSAYKYRIGFGAWINDMRNEPLPVQNWPAPQFDEATIEGAVRAMEVMSDAGYNYFDAFGLWATGDYPPDIVSAFQDNERHARLERLFKEAERLKIGMILPLGLFTWGYDRIIKEDPEVRGKNEDGTPHAHAMCGAKEKAWSYIEKLIDTATAQFDFAGVHMESADLGWCMCPECSGRYGRVGYNCRLNIRAADYIRSKRPNLVLYTIPINWVPWQLNEQGHQQQFSPEEFDHVIELSKHIDIFMDQGHRGNYTPPEWIPKLQCAYGTSGGLWLYHSVRLNRLSYLVPYPKRACELIKCDYDRGARGCLYYQGPMINPAVELNTAVAGRIMTDPSREPQALIEEVINKYYQPKNSETCKALADIFLKVEEGYFGRWNPETIKKNDKADLPGELHVCGLFGDQPEAPGHLRDPYLDKAARAAYKDDLISCLKDLAKIKDNVAGKERFARLTDALVLSVQFLKTAGA